MENVYLYLCYDLVKLFPFWGSIFQWCSDQTHLTTSVKKYFQHFWRFKRQNTIAAALVVSPGMDVIWELGRQTLLIFAFLDFVIIKISKFLCCIKFLEKSFFFSWY